MTRRYYHVFFASSTSIFNGGTPCCSASLQISPSYLPLPCESFKLLESIAMTRTIVCLIWSEHLEEQQDGKNDQLLASPESVTEWYIICATLILHSTPTIDPTQSTSETARERYLKEDPLALVLSPSSVECRQCKRKIKLSSKSAYDPFHWRNHRTRCMKAHKRKVKAMNKTSTFVCHHHVDWSC